jgi:hypothetical protein
VDAKAKKKFILMTSLTSLATGKMQKLKIIYGLLLLSSSLGFCEYF